MFNVVGKFPQASSVLLKYLKLEEPDTAVRFMTHTGS